MTTLIEFSEWWSREGGLVASQKGVKDLAEAAWDAAVDAAEKEPSNDRKRIGVEILERVLREAEFKASADGFPVNNVYRAKAIDDLLQELRQ